MSVIGQRIDSRHTEITRPQRLVGSPSWRSRLTCSSRMTYLYSTRCPAGSSSCRGDQQHTRVWSVLASLAVCAAHTPLSARSCSPPLPASQSAPHLAHLACPHVPLVPGHWHFGYAQKRPAKGEGGAPHTQHLPRVHSVVNTQAHANQWPLWLLAAARLPVRRYRRLPPWLDGPVLLLIRLVDCKHKCLRCNGLLDRSIEQVSL